LKKQKAANAAQLAKEKSELKKEEAKDEATSDEEETQIESMSKSDPNYGFCKEAERMGMPKSALPPQCM